MKLKQLPYSKPYELRLAFQDRFKALPEEQREASKAKFQEEYNLAIVEYEADILKQRKECAKHNLEVFLADPKAIIEELDEIRGRSFDLGEELIAYGIATATIKRQKGKGVLLHKGSIAEHISSNFLVTVKIGDETFSMALSSSNDKRDKERSMAFVTAQFAKQIANRK